MEICSAIRVGMSLCFTVEQSLARKVSFDIREQHILHLKIRQTWNRGKPNALYPLCDLLISIWQSDDDWTIADWNCVVTPIRFGNRRNSVYWRNWQLTAKVALDVRSSSVVIVVTVWVINQTRFATCRAICRGHEWLTKQTDKLLYIHIGNV